MGHEAIPDSVCRKLAASVGHGDEAVAVGNRAGIVEWTNSAWQRVTGWPLEELVDKPVALILDAIGIEPSVPDFVQSHFLSGRSCTVELPITAMDGRELHVHLEVEPVRDESGEVSDFVAIATDITDRRRSELAREGHEARRDESAVANVQRGEAFAAEAIESARRVERLCGEIERVAYVGLLDELGVRSVWERARAARDAAEDLLERAAGVDSPAPPVDLGEIVAGLVATARRTLPQGGQLDACLAEGLPRVAARADVFEDALADLTAVASRSIEGAWGTISVTTGLLDPGAVFVSDVYPASLPGPAPDERPRCFVEVHDTGRCLSPDELDRLSRGVLPPPPPGRVATLLAARARLAGIGAEMYVGSLPGCGTRVVVLVPVCEG